MAVLYSDSVYFFKILSFGILNSSIFFIAVMLAFLVAFLQLFLNIVPLLRTFFEHLPLHVSDSAHGWLILEIWHYLSLFAENSPCILR